MKLIRANPRKRRSSEEGYALLMAVFLAATLMLVASMAAPSVLTEGRREMEQEVIWRGNQYVRGIRLYYQKNGHFPQTMDDLLQASNNDTYFMRKAYTDLSNPEEQGEWRMIYASPSGQLTGSVRYHSLQEMALAMSLPVAQNNALQEAGGVTAQQSGSQSTNQGSDQTQGQPGQLGQLGQGLQSGQTGLPGLQQGSSQSSPFAPSAIGSGPVFGGYLVGVGCKLKKPSLMVYHGGKTYEEWEFIWNPLTVTAMGVSQPALQSGQGATNPNTPANSPATPAIPGAPALPGGTGSATPGFGTSITPPTSTPGF